MIAESPTINRTSPSIQDNDWTAAPPSERETDSLIVTANNGKKNWLELVFEMGSGWFW